MAEDKHGNSRAKPQSNKIPLPFDRAIEGLLSVKPKKRAKKKKPSR